ncbi:MAG: hypothetical protein RI963_3357 [Planctomycetota bacterium]
MSLRSRATSKLVIPHPTSPPRLLWLATTASHYGDIAFQKMTPINDGEKDVVPMRIPFIPMRILFSRFASAGRVGSAGKKWEPLKPVLVFLLMMRLNAPFKTFFPS